MALGMNQQTYGLNGGGGAPASYPGTPTNTATAGGTTTFTSATGSVQVFTGVLTQIAVLPSATGSGKLFTIKNTSTGVVTVQRASADTIDGAVQVSLAQNQSVDVIDSAAGKWVIV